MKTYETWVHGTSGAIQPSRKKWGDSWYLGWGLHLDGKVEKDESPEKTWLQFHIPLPALRPEVPDAPRLQKVMLRFATDCDKPGWFVRYTSAHASQLWKKGIGGAIIRAVHVWDGEITVQESNDLFWQSDNLDTVVTQAVDIVPERQIHHGLGISVHARFLNQQIVDEKIQPDSGEEYKPGWWKGEPFVYDEVATESKRIFLSSVGCRYSANM